MNKIIFFYNLNISYPCLCDLYAYIIFDVYIYIHIIINNTWVDYNIITTSQAHTTANDANSKENDLPK